MNKIRLLLVIMTFSVISVTTFAQSLNSNIIIVVDEFEIVGGENLENPIFSNETALNSIRETFEGALVDEGYINVTVITQVHLDRIKKYNQDIESNIPKADFIVVATLSIVGNNSGKFSAFILDIKRGIIVANINNEPGNIGDYEDVELMVKNAAKDLMSAFIRTDYYKNRNNNN